MFRAVLQLLMNGSVICLHLGKFSARHYVQQVSMLHDTMRNNYLALDLSYLL